MAERSAFVVSADWLQERLGDPELRVIDASWYLPAQGRNARSEYESGHIPSAVFFDQDIVIDPQSDLPHALPGPDYFAAQVSELGISTADTIVVYDGLGMFTAPRVWWMFRAMGAPNVFVLDGGFDRWKADGRPVTTEVPEPANGTFDAVFKDHWAADLDRVREVVANGSSQIADARSPGRFTGEEPEPREGMRSGHMPGARNVPVFSLSQDGELKSLEDLRATFEQAGIDPAGPIVTTCGSGVTAAVITLALHSLGNEETQLYDGSWSEWGAREDTPVVTGED